MKAIGLAMFVVAVVTMIAPLAALGGGETVIHVKADATGTGSGADWTNAVTTIAAALDLVDPAAGRTNIWICGNLAPAATLSVTTAVSICGGFVGTEKSTSERLAGARSAINGGRVLANVISNTASSGTVLLDSLVVSNGLYRCIYHSGGASLTIRDSYIGSIPFDVSCTGHGISASGSAASSVLTLDGVTMQEVRDTTSNRNPWLAEGLVMRVVNFKEVVFTNCLFRENGVGKSVSSLSSGRENNPHCFYFSSAPLHAANCKFIGNRTPNHNEDRGGPLVGLYGNGSGSFFRNCLFVGNCTVVYTPFQNFRGCCVNVEMGAAADTCAFESCTFAYNVCGAGYTAGILGTKGTMTIHNCIFYGNVVSTTYGKAADFYLRNANATANVSYTWFTSDSTYAADSGSLNITAEPKYIGDPRFATGADTFCADYLVSGTKAIPASAYNCTINGAADFDALDCHLKSRVGRWNGTTWVVDASCSQAIDAGDPASDDNREPDSTAINLGCYGNTAEASKPNPLAPEIADVAFIQPDETYRAQFTITMGGTNSHSATTYLCYGLSEGSGLSGWDHVHTFFLSESGSVHRAYVLDYHTSGTKLKWRVYSVNGNGDDAKTGTFTYAGAAPAIETGSVSYDHYYTWPRISASLTGDGTVAEVFLCYGTSASGAEGTNDWANVVRVDNVKKSGDAIEASAMHFESIGTVLYYRWVAIAESGTNQTSILQTTVSGTEPQNLGEGWLYVWDGAMGINNGSDWSHAFTDPVAAVAVASAGNLKIAVAGKFTIAAPITITVPIEIYGGFDRTEKSPSERVVGSRSAINGGRVLANVISITASSGTVLLDSLVVSNGTDRCIYHNGGASLTIRDSYIGSIPSSVMCTGHGISASGSASSSVLTLDGVTMQEVRDTTTGIQTWATEGLVMRAVNFKEVVFTNCVFRENGVGKTVTSNISGRDNNPHSFYFLSAPLHAVNCKFIGNRTPAHNLAGPLVGLYGNGSGSYFRNCLFAANCTVYFTASQSKKGCFVNVEMGAVADTCAFESCTFAYNVCGTGYTAGILGNKGTMTIHNCIYYGNVVSTDFGKAADLYLNSADATANVSYTWFTSDSTYAAGSGSLNTTAGTVFTGDPLFATGTDTFLEDYFVSGTKAIPVSTQYSTINGAADFDALDFHLKSRVGRWNGTTWVGDGDLRSPAIDAGDPESDDSREPDSNAINLGFYGNTAEASMAGTRQFLFIIR